MEDSDASSVPLAGTPGAAAQLEYEEALRNSATPENAFQNEGDEDVGDPDPPPPDSSEELRAQYKADVREYGKEMLATMQSEKLEKLKGEPLWIEFTCSFRLETIRAMHLSLQVCWVRFLIDKGVFVEQKRGYARWNSLRDCLIETSFKPSESQLGRAFDEGLILRNNQFRPMNYLLTAQPLLRT